MRISVIIPTRDRKDVLLECLSGFARQDFTEPFELVVIDDGSDDGTSDAVVKAGGPGGGSLKYFRQEKKGPAAARNLGIMRATGDILLFTGDDMLPEKNLLSEHAAFHAARPESGAAMLGTAAWDPRIRPSPFAVWLENGGPQFGFGRFTPGEAVDAFWTANLSVKKAFLLQNGLFDEDFQYAAGEDVELGMRLRKKGLEIIYNPKASVRHLHRVTFLSYCRRQEIAGGAHCLFERKHPQTAPPQVPRMPFWKKFIFAFAPVLKWLIAPLDLLRVRLDPRWYDIVLSYYFEKGRTSKTG